MSHAAIRPTKVSIVIQQVAGVWPTKSVPEDRGMLFVRIKYGLQQHNTQFWPHAAPGCPSWNERFDFDIEIGYHVIELFVLEKYTFLTGFRGYTQIAIDAVPTVEKMYCNVYKLHSRKGKDDSRIKGCMGVGIKLWKASSAAERPIQSFSEFENIAKSKFASQDLSFLLKFRQLRGKSSALHIFCRALYARNISTDYVRLVLMIEAPFRHYPTMSWCMNSESITKNIVAFF